MIFEKERYIYIDIYIRVDIRLKGWFGLLGFVLTFGVLNYVRLFVKWVCSDSLRGSITWECFSEP